MIQAVKIVGFSDGSFFRALGAALLVARKERRKHLYFDEWQRLFTLAEKDGILARRGDEFVHPFGFALLRLWRAQRDARENGIGEAFFWRQWDAQVEQERTDARALRHDRQFPQPREVRGKPRRIDGAEDLFAS